MHAGAFRIGRGFPMNYDLTCKNQAYEAIHETQEKLRGIMETKIGYREFISAERGNDHRLKIIIFGNRDLM